jgi:glycosyltransferase involved in cell wall biosynthesis
LVPSHIEGFGIVTVEAIMLGVPVLVSDQTALPEVVGTPQAIIEVMNVQKWASRIRDLCANPELRNDLLKTERLALNENSDKKTVDKLLDAYVAKVRS